MASKRAKRSNKGVDWTAIETEFLAGGVTYLQLADRYGVSERTVERHGAAGNWLARRRVVVGDVSAELPGRVTAVVLDDAAAMLAGHHGVWQRVIDRANEMLDDSEIVENPFTGEACFDEDGKPVLRRIVQRPNQLRDITSALKAATEGQRLARGIPDPKDQGGNLGGKEGAQAGVVELPALEPAPEPPPDEPED